MKALFEFTWTEGQDIACLVFLPTRNTSTEEGLISQSALA